MASHHDANTNWQTDRSSWTTISVTVLMDIRAELQTLNRLLACPNFVDIPNRLTTIALNTRPRRRRRKRTR